MRIVLILILPYSQVVAGAGVLGIFGSFPQIRMVCHHVRASGRHLVVQIPVVSQMKTTVCSSAVKVSLVIDRLYHRVRISLAYRHLEAHNEPEVCRNPGL